MPQPRRLLATFIAVVVVSAGILVWLGWLLLQQDARADLQRRQDVLEQAADRAVALVQRRVDEFQARVGSPELNSSALPAGVSLLIIRAGHLATLPDNALPFVPIRETPVPAEAYVLAERLEFALGDLEAAARAYAALARTSDRVVRAGALARLARVDRKLSRTDDALRAYAALFALDPTPVEGLPAGLLARAGRASVFAAAARAADLQHEAEAMQRDLEGRRWRLLGDEFDYYAQLAAGWLDRPPAVDRDARVRALVAQWFWDNHAQLGPAGRRSVMLEGATGLVAWRQQGDDLAAAVAGPVFLAALCPPATPAGPICTLIDSAGHVVVGRPTGSTLTAVRSSVADGLPWTMHVTEADGAGTGSASPRRQLLVMSLALVATVLAAGWYFILRAMTRERRLARLQSDFVAAVSHEFRSPLTSMSQIAEMLADGRLVSADDQRRSYDVLLREAERLKRLVEGLLDFSRFDAGRGALRLTDANITALTRAIVADFQTSVEPEGYRVELSVPTRDVIAPAEPEALARALWNLMDNAVKYSPERRVIWVELSDDTAQVAIRVRDEGLGIPADEQRSIFDRFVRGSEPKTRRIRGTGIGLAVVRDVVRAHGGEVRVRSEAGRGSEFTLVLQHGAGGPA